MIGRTNSKQEATRARPHAEQYIEHITKNPGAVLRLDYFENTPMYAFSDGEQIYVTQVQMSGTKTMVEVFDEHVAFTEFIRTSDVEGYTLREVPRPSIIEKVKEVAPSGRAH